MDELKNKYILFGIIGILAMLFYIAYQQSKIIQQTEWSYLMQSDGNVWKILNETGRGCAVNKKATMEGGMFLTDISNCIIGQPVN